MFMFHYFEFEMADDVVTNYLPSWDLELMFQHLEVCKFIVFFYFQNSVTVV